MRKHKLWHRLMGHGKRSTPVFNPEDYADMPGRMAAAAMTVRDVCSCGDQWVFSAFTMSEFFVPGHE